MNGKLVDLTRLAVALERQGFEVYGDTPENPSELSVYPDIVTTVYVHRSGDVTIANSYFDDEAERGMATIFTSLPSTGDTWRALLLIHEHINPQDWRTPAYGTPLLVGEPA